MIKPIEHPESAASEVEYPQTVEETVDLLLDLLSDWDELPLLSVADDVFLENLHVSLGPYIRNKFGLWGKNKALLDDCGVDHADDAYAVILRALVRRLQRLK